MEYCIIIRGPAGVGKTTIAKKLARNLDADYFSFDEIMEINKLDTIIGEGIPSENFVKANEILLDLIKNKKRVVLDGCFYRKEQIDHLLNNLKGDKISKRSLQKFFKIILEKAKLPSHYYIHCLRHTYATFLLKASNYNFKFVQEQLGHSSIITTQVYTSVIESEGKKAVEKLYK